MFLNQAKSKSWAGPKIIAVVWLGEVEKNHRWPIQGSSEYHHVPKDTPQDKNGRNEIYFIFEKLPWLKYNC